MILSQEQWMELRAFKALADAGLGVGDRAELWLPDGALLAEGAAVPATSPSPSPRPIAPETVLTHGPTTPTSPVTQSLGRSCTQAAYRPP